MSNSKKARERQRRKTNRLQREQKKANEARLASRRHFPPPAHPLTTMPVRGPVDMRSEKVGDFLFGMIEDLLTLEPLSLEDPGLVLSRKKDGNILVSPVIDAAPDSVRDVTQKKNEDS